jgi:uncharacterized membrane protein (UPF0127 family)
LVFGAAGAIGAAATTDTAEKISVQRDSERVALFTVEMVSDKKAMQQGLSGRYPMPDDHSMLFILDSTAEHFFWMNGMEFSVDILFFDRDKRLIELLPELTLCEECTAYKTPVGTSNVLEINAGMADALGIKTGDDLVFTDK